MQEITVELGKRSYPIYLGEHLLAGLGLRMSARGLKYKALVVTHPTIAARYGPAIRRSLSQAGFAVAFVEVPEGEGRKSLTWASRLYDQMVAHGMDRHSSVVALGGGVVGDLAGFVAATYMRGVPFVQVPTTLLAQVDSSVGGKVAVNHRAAKNLIGAFYQPTLVLASLDTLESLPDAELRAGMAEVIKYGVIWDQALFAFLEEHLEDCLGRDPEALQHIVGTSCRIKAVVVSKDEREGGLRAILNYGHTIGHALEAQVELGYRHGEAVAIGMVYAAEIACRLGLLERVARHRIEHLIHRTGLPSRAPVLDWKRTLTLLIHDKKSRLGKLHFILPMAIGRVEIRREIPVELIREVVCYDHPGNPWS